MIRFKKIRPSELTGEVLDKITELIHTKFKISNVLVEEVIRDKQSIHLYTDDVHDRLIGVIGFRRDVCNGLVYLYIGGCVIHDNYQKSGLLTKSLLQEIIITYLKYPFKQKFALAFCTTPEAYQYFCCLDSTWPNRFSETPNSLLDIQKNYLPIIGIDDYTVNSGAIVSHKMKGKIKELNPSKNINPEVAEYFNKLVSCEYDGSQLLCITKFQLSNFSMVIKRRILKRLASIVKHTNISRLFISRK